jgi:hypothetical protein
VSTTGGASTKLSPLLSSLRAAAAIIRTTRSQVDASRSNHA